MKTNLVGSVVIGRPVLETVLSRPDHEALAKLVDKRVVIRSAWLDKGKTYITVESVTGQFHECLPLEWFRGKAPQ